MRRPFRIVAALLAAISFVFAQGAASALACAGPVVDPIAMAQMKADMAVDGALCAQHCDDSRVSLDAAKPGLSAAPSMVPVAVRVSMPQPPARLARATAAPLSVAGPAPPLIRFTVLRI
jgi:hypothetical protein